MSHSPNQKPETHHDISYAANNVHGTASGMQADCIFCVPNMLGIKNRRIVKKPIGGLSV